MMRVLFIAAAACSAARADITYTFSDPIGVGFQYTVANYLTSPNNVAITVLASSLDSSIPGPDGYTISDVMFYPGGGGPDNPTDNVQILIDESLSSQTKAVAYIFAAGIMSNNGDYFTLTEIGSSELQVAGTSSVPEPTSLILLLTTLVAIGLVARKRIAPATRTNR